MLLAGMAATCPLRTIAKTPVHTSTGEQKAVKRTAT